MSSSDPVTSTGDRRGQPAAMQGSAALQTETRQRKKQRRRSRIRRQPNGLTAFTQLGGVWYPLERCQRMAHYLDRAAERGFEEALLLPRMWHGDWSPDDAEGGAFSIVHDRWRAVLLIEDETPKLITVVYVAANAA
ncbi:MAG: hypothetical protein IT337_08695 [Thermomicrobiales bacterium]|nr:hypothetical protein [Thermomicrobiales bacterium]